jgi:chromosome partitioning protein
MIVTLAGQKGGSGKTTTALCVADELHRRGRRVLLVDTDPQGTARTWADVATEAGTDGPTVIGMGAGFHERLSPLGAGYDDVVIDCPPGHSEIQRAALMVADVAVVPCGPGTTDLWSMGETLELARAALALRPALHVGILITRADTRTAIADVAAVALQSAGLPMFSTTFGFRVAYQEAPSAGVGVTRYRAASRAAAEVRALVNEILQIADATRQSEAG